jgi:hypothetical protein
MTGESNSRIAEPLSSGLKLDLTSLLRLSLDNLQGAALAGREIDLGKLQACWGMLAKLVPQAVETPPAAEEDRSAQAELLALLEGHAAVAEAAVAEALVREESVMAAEAAAAYLPPPPSPPPPPVEAEGGAAVVPPRPRSQSAQEAWVQSHYSSYGAEGGGVVVGDLPPGWRDR